MSSSSDFETFVRKRGEDRERAMQEKLAQIRKNAEPPVVPTRGELRPAIVNQLEDDIHGFLSIMKDSKRGAPTSLQVIAENIIHGQIGRFIKREVKILEQSTTRLPVWIIKLESMQRAELYNWSKEYERGTQVTTVYRGLAFDTDGRIVRFDAGSETWRDPVNLGYGASLWSQVSTGKGAPGPYVFQGEVERGVDCLVPYEQIVPGVTEIAQQPIVSQFRELLMGYVERG